MENDSEIILYKKQGVINNLFLGALMGVPAYNLLKEGIPNINYANVQDDPILLASTLLGAYLAVKATHFYEKAADFMVNGYTKYEVDIKNNKVTTIYAKKKDREKNLEFICGVEPSQSFWQNLFNKKTGTITLTYKNYSAFAKPEFKKYKIRRIKNPYENSQRIIEAA